MAGDWIKMRTDLFTHPKVVRISSALKADTLRTVGGLMSVWCLFDAHSTDGRLEGYTPDMVNQLLRWDGFAEQMMRVGWMFTEPDEVLVLPEFYAHNGSSAKRRAMEKDRKKSVRTLSASDADTRPQNVFPREEKRREDIKSFAFSNEKASHLESNGKEKLNGHDLLGDPDAPSKGKHLTAVPFQKIIELYHEILCPPLPRCEVLTAKRQGQIRQRWQDKEDGLPELDDWRNFFRHVKVSPFLMGQVASRDRRPFRADIEWLTNATNYAKIAEGKYHS